MKHWLAKQLRRVLVWLGEESDDELRARCLGLYKRMMPGSRAALSTAIAETVRMHAPLGVAFEIDGANPREIVVRFK